MSPKSPHDKKTDPCQPLCDHKLRDDKLRKEALQVTKEIVVKFIETQRVSPTNFAEVFPAVHAVVCRSIADTAPADSVSANAVGTDS